MKKILWLEIYLLKKQHLKQFFRIMRVTVFLLFFCVFCSMAENSNSQNARVTINRNNISLDELLINIEEQTDYLFFYNNQIDPTEKVSVKAKDKPVKEVLSEVFNNSDIDYSMEGNYIVLKKKGENPDATESYQATRKVTGTVKDNTGAELSGVSVSVKGTTIGAATDANGRYSLEIPTDATLVFSYIGYTTVEMSAKNRSTIDVTMTEANNLLQELVVVGYGVQKKADVVGSISQVINKDLKSVPQSNVANMLTGAMTGVSVIQSSGEPGAANTSVIRVRGVGSFGASPDPLIIVNGIPGALNDLNANDIESISVLKDASTAAIYGARAANGVILVTTKKGVKGKTRINYDGYVGSQKPTALPQVVNSWEYRTAWNIANGTDPASDPSIELYKNGSDPINYPNTNFMKKYFSSGSGMQTAHNISARGGTDDVSYFASFGYLSQDGIVKNDNYDRYNARLSANIKLYSNLKLTANLSGSSEKRSQPAEIGSMGGAYWAMSLAAFTTPPIYLDKYPDGTFGLGTVGSGTVMSNLASDSRWREANNKFNSNARLDWNVFKDLTLSAIAGYNFMVLDNSQYLASIYLNPTVFMGRTAYTQNRNEDIYSTLQFLANYSKKISDHSIDVLAGYSFEDDLVKNMGAGRNNFASNNYVQLNMGDANTQTNSGTYNEWALLSYFGRLNYSFKDRYLLEATVRVDGSSRFPKNNRFATFPSAAVGWRVSEEPFFQSLKDVVNNLKLKASYGTLGNQEIGNYPYQQSLTTGNNQLYVFGTATQAGAAPTTFVDPNLHWESTRTTDGGIELGLWKGIISMEANYFSRKTFDILETPSAGVSSVLGMSPSRMNIGTCINKGIELELTHQQTFKDFYYKISGQVTYLDNKITYMGIGGSPLPSGIIGSGGNYVGYPMQGFYGYLADGVFLTNDEIASWPVQTTITPKPQPGDIRYRDINGTDPDTKLPTGKPDGTVNIADQTYLGSPIPKYNYSASLELGYHGFDFKMMLHGLSKVSGILSDNAGWSFLGSGNIQRWQYDGSWSFNQTERYPVYPRLQVGSNTGNYTTSSYWIRDASFLRIKRMQLGYSLPQTLLNHAHISNLRIYVDGDNLLSFNKYPKGWDPEQTNVNGQSFYPIVSVYTVGVNISF